MARDDRLRDFAGQALAAGRPRSEIAAMLARAGWSDDEIGRALGAWDDAPVGLAVPRPAAQLHPRDAAMNGLVFLAMLLAAVHLVLLGHALVELWVADPLERASRPSGQVRWSSAMILVAGPLALFLDRRERRRAETAPHAPRSVARGWISYLTLFAAATILLLDLVALVFGFLSGDLTLRFVLKAVIVAAVAGAFLVRIRWRAVADTTLALAGIAGIAAGLAAVGGPQAAREAREDERRLDALRGIASALACPDQAELPETLSEETLAGYCGGRFLSPDDLRDPVTGEPLRYERRRAREFAVCTGFHDAARLADATYGGQPDFDPASGCLVGRAER